MGWSPLRRDNQRPSPSATAAIKIKLLGSAKKNEDQVIQDTRFFQKEILPLLTNHRGHNEWNRKQSEIWWRGIPPCLRERVWCLTIRNDLNITKELFDICLQRSKEKVWTQVTSSPLTRDQINHDHQQSNQNASKEPTDTCSASSSGLGSSDASSDNGSADISNDDANETVADLIKIDVSRTFPQLGLFQECGPYHEPLINILGAYVTYRPDINYVQGMSFLAGMLLLNMKPEAAFNCFANLLNNKLLMAFYRLDSKAMRAYYETFQLLLRTNLPEVASHFERENMTPDLYIVDWIYTLFSRSLPLDVSSRVWDLFLRDGELFVFRAALGVLAMYSDIVTKLDFIHLAVFLTKLPDSIDGDRLFDSISKIKMAAEKRQFDDIVEYHLANPGEVKHCSTGRMIKVTRECNLKRSLNLWLPVS
ncbi:TBC1 domain family member 14 [Halotydeus destructor]|nr:TBC1 domain family member 14 [Halotydeus destructor]